MSRFFKSNFAAFRLWLFIFTVLLISGCFNSTDYQKPPNELEVGVDTLAIDTIVKPPPFVPLSGFDSLPRSIDAIPDKTQLDSIEHFSPEYIQKLQDFLQNPLNLNLIFSTTKKKRAKAFKRALYEKLEPETGYKRYVLSNELAEIVIHRDSLLEALSSDTNLVELKLFSYGDPFFKFPPKDSSVIKEMTLRNGLTIGSDFSDLVHIMGSGFLKKGDRIIYCDWKNRLAMFDFQNQKIQRIIIGRYNIDLEKEALPAFLFKYK